MAQSKTAIFLGRTSDDTGYTEYQKLAEKFKIKLDVFTDRPNAAELIPNYDYAFVSRYLAILESLAAGVPVFAHYNNKIKFDYLSMAPFINFIIIFDDYKKVELKNKDLVAGQKWAKTQTWEKLASQYDELWQK